MSCVRTVKTFEVVEIKLDEIKANDLVELEETLCNVMVQKLEKLNILIKETNTYIRKRVSDFFGSEWQEKENY